MLGRFVFALLLAALLPGVAAAFVHSCGLLLQCGRVGISVLGGVALGAVLDRLVIRRIPYLDVFEHEATHAFAALLYLRRVTAFVVHRDSGYMRHSGGLGGSLGDHFIGLAPYFLPVTTFVMVLVRQFVPHAWFPWYDIGVGASLGHHTINAFRDTKRSWGEPRTYDIAVGPGTDITRRGRFFAAAFICVFALATTGVLVAVLCRGYSGVVTWGRGFLRAEVAAIAWAIAKGSSIIAR